MFKQQHISVFSTIIIFLMFTIIGIAFIPKLSISLTPVNEGKIFQISWIWADASPEIIEQEVTSKLEATFNTIQGIKTICYIIFNKKKKKNS